MPVDRPAITKQPAASTVPPASTRIGLTRVASSDDGICSAAMVAV